MRYVWISVGGGDCEPAAEKDGQVFTIGCPDPLPPGSFTVVSTKINQPSRPKTPKEQEEFEAWLKKEEAAGRRHGYRRFALSGQTREG